MLEPDLNNMGGRVKAARDGEWKKFLADRYWLPDFQDQIEEKPMRDYGPPHNAP